MFSKASQGRRTSSRAYEVHLRRAARGAGETAEGGGMDGGGGGELELANRFDHDWVCDRGRNGVCDGVCVCNCDGSNEELSVGSGSVELAAPSFALATVF